MSDSEIADLLAWAWPDTESDDTLESDIIREQILPLFVHIGFVSDRDDLLLPEVPLRVYRGGSADGIAWSESFETAVWFANRLGYAEPVFQAFAHPDHILARFHGRNEREVVIDPRCLCKIELLMPAGELTDLNPREFLAKTIMNIENQL